VAFAEGLTADGVCLLLFAGFGIEGDFCGFAEETCDLADVVGKKLMAFAAATSPSQLGDESHPCTSWRGF